MRQKGCTLGMPPDNDNSMPPDDSPADIRPLDMYLLGLVRGGLITPYDWQSKGRVSLGASLPAVKRLLKAGLLKRPRLGPHDRHEHALTNKGEDELARLSGYVRRAQDEAPKNLESVVRLACLASVARRAATAKKLLLEAADYHHKRARAAEKRKISNPVRSGLGELCSIALSDCEAAQEAALAKELESLARRWDKKSEEIFDYWRQDRKPPR
jgi:DNA-binding PadR family transcriptional regulator